MEPTNQESTPITPEVDDTHEVDERPPFLHWLLFHVVPAFAIMALSVAALVGLVAAFKHEPPPAELPRVLPTVNIVEAVPTATTVYVASQGTVQARIATNLIAEVSGRVETVSPALYAGGFFKKGETLVRIDQTDYIAALANARSRLAEANLTYQQEQASAAQAREDWETVGNSAAPDPLVLRKPQLERAKANLEAAEAAVLIAERDLARTEVKAPYDGRVQQKFVDIGQYLNARNSQIASIYSVDAAEIRLPIGLSETRYLDLPENHPNGNEAPDDKPLVTIEAIYGGKSYQWQGVIDRSEGAIDPQTRLLNVVARIDNPYQLSNDKPPLKVGTFVTASIKGEQLQKAFVIPRKGLREGDSVYVVDSENHIQIRPVTVYKKNTDTVIVSDGIESGDRICLTPLQFVVDGMEVEVESHPAETETQDA